MEQETMLKEILNAFKLYSEKMDKKLDTMKSELKTELEVMMDDKLNKLESKMDDKLNKMESKMDAGFERVDEQLDRLGKKQDGFRVELSETKETSDFLLTKTTQHEKKLNQLINQQQ